MRLQFIMFKLINSDFTVQLNATIFILVTVHQTTFPPTTCSRLSFLLQNDWDTPNCTQLYESVLRLKVTFIDSSGQYSKIHILVRKDIDCNIITCFGRRFSRK